jgi:hypothetical protein
MSDEKKIIIDQDWKKEAKAEKEKLSKETRESQETPEQDSQRLPDADFSVLVSMLSTQALFAMGLVAPEGMEDKIKKDLKLAQFNIDLLAVLEEKTKGNLAKEESELLSGSLSQLRMAYVNVADK